MALFAVKITFQDQRYDPLQRARPFDVVLIGGVLNGPVQDVDEASQIETQSSPSLFSLPFSLPSTIGSRFARRHGVGPGLGRCQHNPNRQDRTFCGPLTLFFEKVKNETTKGFNAMSDWGKKACCGSLDNFM